MATKRATDVVINVNSQRVKGINTHGWQPAVDLEDVTEYGDEGHTFAATLTNGTLTFGGSYHTKATGQNSPRVVLESAMLARQPVPVEYMPEGVGVGLPMDYFYGFVTYAESGAVAGVVQYTCSIQVHGEIDTTAQDT